MQTCSQVLTVRVQVQVQVLASQVQVQVQVLASQVQVQVLNPELDMDWIHPWIGLDWIGLDWIGSFCVIHFVDWIGLGPMEKNRPNRVAS